MKVDIWSRHFWPTDGWLNWCVCPGKHFELEEMEGDHITPWKDGGVTTAENCQMLCKECNRRKGSKWRINSSNVYEGLSKKVHTKGRSKKGTNGLSPILGLITTIQSGRRGFSPSCGLDVPSGLANWTMRDNVTEIFCAKYIIGWPSIKRTHLTIPCMF